MSKPMQNRSIWTRLDVPGLLGRHADLAVGVGILSVLVLLILPVPAFMLDFFICVSFCASFVMLSTTIYVTKAAQLSSFPSLLLVTTLLRLALAIASTKMILLYAHAGDIIGAFGEMVVGGNVAVGIVVFVVLSAIQFIVVAKGADRVAEVSARFTLDGIPGRQMSIDADLRSGLIAPHEAGRLRGELERETYFYGSLDGAMKFVKGDAVAGLVVALVNIAGGLAVGIAQRGMSFSDALHTYTILTVGDGLVSQVPSLIVSIAAGLLVTRVSSGGAPTNLGGDIFRQLSLHPKALAMAGVGCFALGAIPGFPHVQFALAGGALIGLSILMMRQAAALERTQRPFMPAMTRDGGNYTQRILDDVELGTSAILRLRLGANAYEALRPRLFDAQLGKVRRDLMTRLGLPFPGLALQRDARLDAERYIIDIDEVPYASGTLVAAHVLVSGGESQITMEGIAGYSPGAPKAVWIKSAEAASLDDPQIGKASVEEALCAHLADVCEQTAAECMGTQEARFLINQIGIEFRELAGQIDQAVGPVLLASVLRRLLEERVPIRNLRAILEAVIRIPDGERSVDRMVRDARIALGARLARRYADLDAWRIDAAVFEPSWEAELEDRIRSGPDGEPVCVLGVDELEHLQRAFSDAYAQGVRVLVTTAVLRPHLRRHLKTFGIRIDALAIEEIPLDNFSVQTICTLSPA
ncbi:flagellar biosynthesis protein FlhA [Paraburkholderia solisilvae]|uniref:Invasion protein InvA n=1 Tax=Paraburkholderia solisilvae TaxID=624376 RepID=A0A6J5DSA0_9BURK|nr:flagellar biosynthesis protein FlhA [Paraburkholderia solisilvae]CAB3756823.1 Invasion protein InvA [Paraburkholderia solisilvae]